MVVKLYNLLLDFYARCGAPRDVHVTPDEFATVHYRVAPTKRQEMVYVTELFCHSFYGRRAPSGAQFEQFARCVGTLGAAYDFA